MSTTTTLYQHHNGDFTTPPNVKYIGGKTEIIKDFDCDTFSFRDLEEFAEKYAYDVASSLVNFKCDGFSFEKDHFDLDEVIDGPNEGEGKKFDCGDPVEANMRGTDEFSDDSDECGPEYRRSSETEESEDESFVPYEYGSDPELNAIRENCKKT
ncbi:hypothetical protein ACET3Z_018708 [Daucus carota]